MINVYLTFVKNVMIKLKLIFFLINICLFFTISISLSLSKSVPLEMVIRSFLKYNLIFYKI